MSYHLTATCRQKKYGTVLSGDLMHALSSALSKSATKCEQTTATLENSTCTCTWTIEEKISEVGEFLNHKLHDLASTMIQNDKREPLDYQSLDIDKRMELVDPTLT